LIIIRASIVVFAAGLRLEWENLKQFEKGDSGLARANNSLGVQ
jgi:hypothetical protein